eukprot:10676458-Alexandrium_andersonii.AAC.1
MQSAIRGGDCSRNIRQAFRHLSGAHGQAPRWDMPTEPAQLWRQFLGSAASPLWAMVRELGEGEISSCPAAFFADQSKAFERIGHLWFRRRVLEGWRLPPWALESLLAM